ncbi:MAG TPA: PAS domain S-box protein [Methylobacterium sp.]
MKPSRHAAPRTFRISPATLVTLLAALLVASVGGWQIARSHEAAMANAGKEAQNLANVLAQHAARTIGSADLVLSGTIERLQGDPDRTTLKGFLQRRAAGLPQVQKLQVMDKDGSWLFDSVGPHEPMSSRDRAYFQHHRDDPDLGVHIDQPIVSRYGAVPVLPVSRRLNAPDGTFSGVVSATLYLDYFRSFYRGVNLGPQGAIALWSNDARVLVREPEAPGIMGRDLSRGRLFSVGLRAGPSGVISTPASAVDGVARIVGFQRLDPYPLVVSASMSVEDALASWRREALIQGSVHALATGAFLLLALGLERRDRRIAASEHASRDAQALFRGLFEHATDSLFVHRVQPDGDFRLEACNPAAAESMGMSQDAAVGKRPEDLLPSAQAARVRADLELAVLSGQPLRSENHQALADGHKSWEIIHVPIREPGSETIARVFVGVRDITHLKTAEAQARGANRLLVMAEEIAHFGHWHMALPSNHLTWSEEVFRIHGLDPTAFTPTVDAATARYHPDDRAHVAECLRNAVEARKSFDFELRIVRPDGEIRHILSRGICQDQAGDDGTGSVRAIFGVFADVTHVKHAERALAEKSSLFEAVLQSMDQGLLMIAADGTVPVANARARELLGLSPELMASRPSYRAVRNHLRQSGSWGEAIQDPKHWHLDGDRRTSDLRSERRRADGSVIEIRSVPLRGGDGYVQTLTDITQRRLTEDRVRDSEARYRLLADHTSDLIVLGDAAGGHSYVSPAVTSLLGYSLEEANATGLRRLVHPDDLAQVSAALTALTAEAPTGSVVYRLQHRRGHWIWAEAALRRVEEGGEIQIIKAIRDVTMRQRQAAHLERAKVAAEAGARVKGEFLANMSHELRTPLTGMLGVHDLLQSDPSLTPSQARLIELAQESGRSLLMIVNDILDFSKIEAGQLAIETLPFGLRALVTSCRELAGQAARSRNLSLATEIDPDVPDWFLGDPARLRQVLLNLATNAIKFTPEGSVTIRARWLAEAGRRPHLRVEVIDTGIGIAPDKLPRLFERFSQADGSISRHYGGTGLGLAISRRLVQLMGGELGVTSSLGTGSTFWFEVPLALAQVQADGPSAPHALPARTGAGGHHILLAEDNVINQEIISTVLRNRGHTVTLVGDGGAAVAAVKAAPGFDIVLMDVQMPGQDGLAATAAIRAWEGESGRLRLPIVALTANALAEEANRCRAAGMDAHVAKPVDWTELFVTMEGLLIDRPGTSADPVDRGGPAGSSVILDETMLAMLAGVLGDGRISGLLSGFSTEIARRLARLDAPGTTHADLGKEAHAMVSLAGQLGFAELAGLCSELEEASETGVGLDRIGELRAAAARAVEAAARTPYAKAA